MNRKETIGTPPIRHVISEDPHGKIIALSLLLAFLWGGNSPAIKVGLEDLPPMALAFIRFVIGLVVVGVWSLYRRIPLGLNRGEFSRLLLLTAIFISQIIVLNTGTMFTTASRSTIFVNVYPFFTALFAHLWIPGERLSLTKTLGIIVAFSGVFVTVAPNLGKGEISILGDLLVLVSGCFLGLRVVVTKLLVQSIHPYRLLVWYLGLSLPVYAVLSFLFERGSTFQLTLSCSAALLYQGGVIAGFCFLAWTSILERYSASKLVVLFFATPLSGVLFSHWILKDELTFSLLAGAVLVAAGIYLVNMRR
ncbi:DMT family transporter [Candidatus Poribacteria bacterium]|nr:DMT family transporter [Candidatus Poribacteria bacterium]